MLKLYVKADCMMDVLYEFTTKEWKFDNSNTRKLWSSLSQQDRNTFWFSFDGFNWSSFLHIYFFGIRKYILLEDCENVKKALMKQQRWRIIRFLNWTFLNFFLCFFRLYWLHNSFVVGLCLLSFYFIYTFLNKMTISCFWMLLWFA